MKVHESASQVLHILTSETSIYGILLLINFIAGCFILPTPGSFVSQLVQVKGLPLSHLYTPRVSRDEPPIHTSGGPINAL